MKIYISNLIIEHLKVSHNKLLNTTIQYKDSILSGSDVLHMILHTLRANPSKPCAGVTLTRQYPNILRYKLATNPLKLGYLTLFISSLFRALIQEGLIRNNNGMSGYYLGSKDFTALYACPQNDKLIERKLTTEEAASEDAIGLANLLFTLSDEDIKLIVKELVVRSNAEKTSYYSNQKNSPNDYRLSDHWNTVKSNPLISNYSDEDLIGFWILGRWDKAKDAFQYEGAFANTIQRTPQEKAGIIDYLIKHIYKHNPLQHAKLNNLKRDILAEHIEDS